MTKKSKPLKEGRIRKGGINPPPKDFVRPDPPPAFMPPPKLPVGHVTFRLPSGAEADFCFHNKNDAWFVFNAIKDACKRLNMPEPRFASYVERNSA